MLLNCFCFILLRTDHAVNSSLLNIRRTWQWTALITHHVYEVTIHVWMSRWYILRFAIHANIRRGSECCTPRSQKPIIFKVPSFVAGLASRNHYNRGSSSLSTKGTWYIFVCRVWGEIISFVLGPIQKTIYFSKWQVWNLWIIR